jgi:hypothetical protein
MPPPGLAFDLEARLVALDLLLEAPSLGAQDAVDHIEGELLMRIL